MSKKYYKIEELYLTKEDIPKLDQIITHLKTSWGVGVRQPIKFKKDKYFFSDSWENSNEKDKSGLEYG